MCNIAYCAIHNKIHTKAERKKKIHDFFFVALLFVRLCRDSPEHRQYQLKCMMCYALYAHSVSRLNLRQDDEINICIELLSLPIVCATYKYSYVCVCVSVWLHNTTVHGVCVYLIYYIFLLLHIRSKLQKKHHTNICE